MSPTLAVRDAEHEIATIRCLLAQQLHRLDQETSEGPDRPSAEGLMRRLLDRDRDIRSRLSEAVPARDHDGPF